MHVEVEAAHNPTVLDDLKDRNGGIPAGGRRAAKLDFEEPRRRLQHARLNLRVGEVGAYGLRVEVEGRTAELLIPVGAAGYVDGRQFWLALAGKRENQLMLAAGALAAGLV